MQILRDAGVSLGCLAGPDVRSRWAFEREARASQLSRGGGEGPQEPRFITLPLSSSGPRTRGVDWGPFYSSCQNMSGPAWPARALPMAKGQVSGGPWVLQFRAEHPTGRGGSRPPEVTSTLIGFHFPLHLLSLTSSSCAPSHWPFSSREWGDEWKG